MNLLLWKEELVPDYDTAMARARTGAAYLDGRFGPDWDRVIDVERLDILTFSCVLGQLGMNGYFCLPSVQTAVDGGFSCGLFADCLGLFFRVPPIVRSYALLTAAWKDLLRERRRARVRPTVLRREEPATNAVDHETPLAV